MVASNPPQAQLRYRCSKDELPYRSYFSLQAPPSLFHHHPTITPPCPASYVFHDLHSTDPASLSEAQYPPILSTVAFANSLESAIATYPTLDCPPSELLTTPTPALDGSLGLLFSAWALPQLNASEGKNELANFLSCNSSSPLPSAWSMTLFFLLHPHQLKESSATLLYLQHPTEAWPTTHYILILCSKLCFFPVIKLL